MVGADKAHMEEGTGLGVLEVFARRSRAVGQGVGASAQFSPNWRSMPLV